jgi:hypothetical protein
MTQPQKLYVLQEDADMFSRDPGKMLGVFSTWKAAIIEAESRSIDPEEYRHYPAWREYPSRKGTLKVVPKEIQGDSGKMPVNGVVYVALDAGSCLVIESEVFTAEERAWEACLQFRTKRAGSDNSKWIHEKRWTGKDGLRHARAEYNHGLGSSVGPLNSIGLFKHHWYVGAFKIDQLAEGISPSQISAGKP